MTVKTDLLKVAQEVLADAERDIEKARQELIPALAVKAATGIEAVDKTLVKARSNVLAWKSKVEAQLS